MGQSKENVPPTETPDTPCFCQTNLRPRENEAPAGHTATNLGRSCSRVNLAPPLLPEDTSSPFKGARDAGTSIILQLSYKEINFLALVRRNPRATTKRENSNWKQLMDKPKKKRHPKGGARRHCAYIGCS